MLKLSFVGQRISDFIANTNLCVSRFPFDFFQQRSHIFFVYFTLSLIRCIKNQASPVIIKKGKFRIQRKTWPLLVQNDVTCSPLVGASFRGAEVLSVQNEKKHIDDLHPPKNLGVLFR